MTLKYRVLGLGTCTSRRVKNDDFSMFGDLGGDLCKETCEPTLLGMHVRNVLSGLHAENVNTDPKTSIVLMFGAGNVCVWRVENHVFSKFGGLGGDSYKGTHEAKMIGMHIGSVLSGCEAGNVKSDREMPN